jgi:hypothetical protein
MKKKTAATLKTAATDHARAGHGLTLAESHCAANQTSGSHAQPLNVTPR